MRELISHFYLLIDNKLYSLITPKMRSNFMLHFIR